jgi:hypothetical protein
MTEFTTNKFYDAVTLCAFGQRLIRVTRKNHHRLYVFEKTETLVATLAKMPIRLDDEAWATAEKLVRGARIPLITRQSLIAKGLLKPAPIVEVVKPAPAPAPIIVPEVPEELTPAEFNELVAQTMKSKPVVVGLKLRNNVAKPAPASIKPEPVPKIVAPKPAPKPAPKVPLPPGATFNPFANLRDLLVTP